MKKPALSNKTGVRFYGLDLAPLPLFFLAAPIRRGSSLRAYKGLALVV